MLKRKVSNTLERERERKREREREREMLHLQSRLRVSSSSLIFAPKHLMTSAYDKPIDRLLILAGSSAFGREKRERERERRREEIPFGRNSILSRDYSP
jgi:hypothetical protein